MSTPTAPYDLPLDLDLSEPWRRGAPEPAPAAPPPRAVLAEPASADADVLNPWRTQPDVHFVRKPD